ncbi:cuticle protein 6-like [Episyrphus balteatus]|uniref:cuticle protein 6-like n=1 Tax=Episyrphus balteatus TaxID=286459 RepID=UPI002486393E|nr:cuticle protein 6-like [Episyrphus balteatus]
MKTFLVILSVAFLATCSAGLLEPSFSTTDEQGGYHFGFNDGHQARQEKRTPEGVVQGAYRYIDANGETQTITYTADSHNGFLASGTNIPKIPEVVEQPAIPDVVAPVPVEETPEVKAARAEHLEAHRRVLSGEIQSAPITLSQGPVPVQYSYVPQLPAGHAYAINQPILARSGYFTYGSQPAVQYIVQAPQYHPDYQPYAAL